LWDKSVPNNFYYVIPEELVSVAKEYLEWTPYWIISARLYWRDKEFCSFSSEKKVKAIHSNKAWDWMIFDMAHRMSWVCQKLVDNNFNKVTKQ